VALEGNAPPRQRSCGSIGDRLGVGEPRSRHQRVVSTHLDLFASVASSEVKERDPARFVYIAQDTGAQGDGLAKIGHARDLKQRFARMTDRVTPMKLIAAWRFGSRAEAMARERSAQQAYEPCGYGGGSEWVMASVETVLADLKAKWGAPDVSND
jgi:predicted GIY-YIG superfamily endonuclease